MATIQLSVGREDSTVALELRSTEMKLGLKFCITPLGKESKCGELYFDQLPTSILFTRGQLTTKRTHNKESFQWHGRQSVTVYYSFYFVPLIVSKGQYGMVLSFSSIDIFLLCFNAEEDSIEIMKNEHGSNFIEQCGRFSRCFDLDSNVCVTFDPSPNSK